MIIMYIDVVCCVKGGVDEGEGFLKSYELKVFMNEV